MPRRTLDHEYAEDEQRVHYEHKHPVHPQNFPQKWRHFSLEA
jgi:hypothetical protein